MFILIHIGQIDLQSLRQYMLQVLCHSVSAVQKLFELLSVNFAQFVAKCNLGKLVSGDGFGTNDGSTDQTSKKRIAVKAGTSRVGLFFCTY